MLDVNYEGELLLEGREGRPQRWVSHNIETPPERSVLIPKSAAKGGLSGGNDRRQPSSSATMDQD